jgi:N-acetylmuramoyl-L-alanine amidase
MKIFLSPSTQEHNAYKGGSNEEIEMNHLVSLIKPYLLAAGHTVSVGGTVSAGTNVAIGNKFMGKNGLYVAVHSNAGGGRGTEVWYHTGSVKGKALATAIYNHLAPVTASPDRGVKMSDKYIELHPLAPAVIIECAFHDYAPDSEEIKAKHAEYALAIATGILEVAGGSVICNPPTTPPTTPKPKPPAKPKAKPVLSQGSKNSKSVKELQKLLNLRYSKASMWNKLRYGWKKVVEDGDFGPNTKKAVIAFQKQAGLVADGVVGPKTWAELIG